MNNLDYLEYEGSRLLDYAMKTYSKASTGSLVNDIERAVLAGQKELSLAEQDALQSLSFEYTLYRLYIARCMICHHKSGFGCTDAILKGLSSTLSSLPSALKMLALEHDLNGSYLLLGCYVKKLTKAHVETMFQCYAAIEKPASRGIAKRASPLPSKTLFWRWPRKSTSS
uniref:hypothetical protein n=1 Tax=Dialister sp. TaxID=1955814 RepID=UPI004025E7DB